jgi:hypothetical protein
MCLELLTKTNLNTKLTGYKRFQPSKLTNLFISPIYPGGHHKIGCWIKDPRINYINTDNFDYKTGFHAYTSKSDAILVNTTADSVWPCVVRKVKFRSVHTLGKENLAVVGNPIWANVLVATEMYIVPNNLYEWITGRLWKV